MLMNVNEIEILIKEVLFDVQVEIWDLVGDGDYYVVNVVLEVFCGKSCVQQYQMVYQVLKGNMGGELYVLVLQIKVLD